MTLADELVRREGSAAHGTVIVADSQSGGVGRRGRSWLSPPMGNLYFSLVWSPPGLDANAGPAALLPQLTQLNLATSVAVARAAAVAGVSSARIKWPNDVWAGAPESRKMSGSILNFDGKTAAVLGVGINVLQDMGPNATATSIATELRRQRETHDANGSPEEARAVEAVAPSATVREAVLAAFCVELERLMTLSIDAVLEEYRHYDLLRGRTIRVHHKTREESDPSDFDAEALGVSAGGMLRVRPLVGGGVRELSGEEVSISPLHLTAAPTTTTAASDPGASCAPA